MGSMIAMGAFLCAAPVASEAPPTGKVQWIGVLEAEGMASTATNLRAFREGLREFGYVEGKNLAIEYRSADGHPERLPDLAMELVRLKVDVIVTRGTTAALSAKHATTTTPIVMASSGEPAIEGIVASLARPGGNVTGLYMLAPPALGGKRLQLLRELVPGLSRVGVLWNPNDPFQQLKVRDIETAARIMGVQLRSLEVQRPSDFERMFEAALLGQVDALITMEDSMAVAERRRIVEFTAMSRLPAIYGLREFVDAGGLMAYGTDRRDLFRRAATYVHRILTGANPGDLPVEPPARFELVVNLKAAAALGLTIPPSLLAGVDDVIK